MINSQDFKKIMAAYSSIAVAYANMMNKKLRKVESRHSDLVFYDAKVRLLRFIRNWAITDGNKVGIKSFLKIILPILILPM